jgi:hypothetical protein
VEENQQVEINSYTKDQLTLYNDANAINGKKLNFQSMVLRQLNNQVLKNKIITPSHSTHKN